jgi:hypothetical protein
MRVVSSALIAAALSLGALMPAVAQDATPEAATPEAAIRIPATQLKFYCFANGHVYSIGAVTCLGRNTWGTCKWTDQGSNHSAPPGRAYWIASIAPIGVCP